MCGDWLWLVIQVIIIYLIILALIAIQLTIVNDMPKFVQEVDPLTINTGDVLGVSYRNVFGYCITAATSSLWHHTGVAWRSPMTNELFVFESAQYDAQYNSVFRIPFDLWVRINRKHHICHVRLMGKVLDPLAMEQVCKELEQIRLDTLNWEWYRFFLKRTYVDEPLKSHYTCYEVSIMCLHKVGVMVKQLTPSSYFPKDIIWCTIPLTAGYSYAEPILLTTRRIPI